MPTEGTRISTRGWAKIGLHSTRLSTFGKFREMCAKMLIDKIKDSEPCMFELTLKFPPTKKVK